MKDKNFYYSQSDDAINFANKLKENLNPIINEFVNKGYTPEQISHGISQFCNEIELAYYLGLEKV